jgi:hypothetical protein
MQHTRSVTANQDDCWLVEDRIQPLIPDMLEAAHRVRLHWLLPNWEWKIHHSQSRLTIEMLSPYGWIILSVSEGIEASISNLQTIVFRAGELQYSSGDDSPTWGWVSPTYGVKEPALSLAVTATGALPLTFMSKWSFPEVG